MERDASCIFCKVVDKKVPAKIVKENDEYLAMRDINPQSPSHVLVVPKKHIANITLIDDAALLGRLFQAAVDIARQEAGNGFRLVVNTGEDGGQTVGHLHIHILSGRPLGWPPG